MNQNQEQSVATNPAPQSSPQTPSQPGKKAWSQPTMTLLEISATAFNSGEGNDGGEFGTNAS